MGSSSMRGAEPWLQLLCFLIFINILYTLYPSFSFHRQRQIAGKISGNFTGVLNSTYVGIPTQVMH
jgi:hypothetical protein